MREILTSGSVGGAGGDPGSYPEPSLPKSVKFLLLGGLTTPPFGDHIDRSVLLRGKNLAQSDMGEAGCGISESVNET